MVEWSDRSHSSVKAHDSLLGVCQKIDEEKKKTISFILE
jgi:hypothetical protein